jgi:hypothetical protein
VIPTTPPFAATALSRSSLAVRGVSATFLTRDDDRLLTRLDRLEAGPDADVAQVDHHADAIQLGDDLAAEEAEAGVVRLHAAVADEVPLVVGQLADPLAHHVEQLDQAEVVPEVGRILAADDRRDLPFGFRPLDVGGGARNDDLRIAAGDLVILLDVEDGVGHVLHRERHREVESGQAALAQAVVVPLQEERAAVDDDRALVERTRPLANGRAFSNCHDPYPSRQDSECASRVAQRTG